MRLRLGAKPAAGGAGAEATELMLDLIGAGWKSKVVAVAAELNLAEHLAREPVGIDALAQGCACEPPSLRRLLRAMTALGLCREPAEDLFASTPALDLLRGDAAQSLRAQALWWGREQWPLWHRLAESVRTGLPSRPASPGGAAKVRSPARDELFDTAMTELSGLIAPAIVGACDFRAGTRLIDLGGGRGELVACIAHAHPGLTGVVFDVAELEASALATIAAAGLGSRCRFLAGDFFRAVPEAFDVYLMKSILHCWADDRCLVLLRNLRAAMPEGAQAVLVERLLPSRSGGDACRESSRMDLHMLLATGGRERTLSEFRTMLEAAGLSLLTHAPAAFGFHVLRCTTLA